MPAPRILLLQPWIHDFAAYDLWVQPVGLLSLASLLRARGYAVELVNCLQPDTGRHRTDGRGRFRRTPLATPEPLRGIIPRTYARYGIDPKDLIRALQALPRPAAVLVGSGMTYWYQGVTAAIWAVKQVFPAVPVILGGVYAGICPAHARRHSGADIICPGSAGRDLFAMLHKIAPVPHAHLPRGCAFPMPDCSLLPAGAAIPVLTSRGCPFSCTYCGSALLQPRFHRAAPAAVIAHVTRWATVGGATDFAFYDDALLVNAQDHIIPILQGIGRTAPGVRFHVPNGLHVRYMTPEIAELMHETGFQTIRLGLETIDPGLQRESGHKAGPSEFVYAVRCLHQAGFTRRQIGVYILAGLPNQHSDSVRDTLHFVQDTGARPFISEYSPVPGTQLWEAACAASPFPLAREPLFHNNTLLPCRWQHFTPDDLQQLKMESRAGMAAPVRFVPPTSPRPEPGAQCTE